MANLLWLILFMAVYKCVYSRVVTGLYCKDPDTGTLHTVNSTWQSQSFCGSYTCRLRKRNATETQNEPDLKKNVTADVTSQHDTESQSSVVKETFVIPISNKVIKNEETTKFFENPLPETLISKETTFQGGINNERYLTEDEIVTISKLLHTVKRSDLDSLIEIYNLAKDIYKEIDAFDPEPECDEKNTNCSVSQKPVRLTSYWHNPMNITIRGANSLENDDMHKSSTNQQVALASTQQYSNVPDINKVPYYYPFSPFQRYSSYVYDPYAQYRTNHPVRPTDTKGIPCNNTAEANYYSPQVMTPWVNRIVKKPFTLETANKVYGPNLLPYPFSSVYRYPYPKDIYFDGKIWSPPPVNEMQKQDPQFSYMKLEAPREHQMPQNHQMPLYYQSMIPNHSKEIKINSHNDNVNNKDAILKAYEDKVIENAKDTPSWKTDPVPNKVLDEVRANILETTSNLLSNKIRKSPKLEKIGKLLRLDKIIRKKRNIDENNAQSILENKDVSESSQNDDDYEAILDRLLCESSLEPGFFRHGNLTEPYPACCPQKI